MEDYLRLAEEHDNDDVRAGAASIRELEKREPDKR
jgi:hypothetical protein